MSNSDTEAVLNLLFWAHTPSLTYLVIYIYIDIQKYQNDIETEILIMLYLCYPSILIFIFFLNRDSAFLIPLPCYH